MDLSLKSIQEGTVLVVDKPLEWSSFDVVNKIRNTIRNTHRIKKIKVGHAGTLDPMATGVLVVCTGKKTKEIQFIQDGRKEYLATLKLGATTPSYDTETEEDQTFPIEHITREKIEKTLHGFKGEIDQYPPIFSAIRKDGKRLYEFARKGEEVEIEPRKVTIDTISVEEWEGERLVLRVQCGKGTYIRSLAHDIGKALGSGAYLTALQRTAVGDHSIDEAWQMQDLVDAIRSSGEPPIEH